MQLKKFSNRAAPVKQNNTCKLLQKFENKLNKKLKQIVIHTIYIYFRIILNM